MRARAARSHAAQPTRAGHRPRGTRERTVPTTDSRTATRGRPRRDAGRDTADRASGATAIGRRCSSSPRRARRSARPSWRGCSTDFLRLDGGGALAFDLNPGERRIAGLSCPTWRSPPISATSQARWRCSTASSSTTASPRWSTSARIVRAVLRDHGGDRLRRARRSAARSSRSSCLPPTRIRPRPRPMPSCSGGFPTPCWCRCSTRRSLKGRKLRDQFPFERAAAVPLQIPSLAPALKAHARQVGLFVRRLPRPAADRNPDRPGLRAALLDQAHVSGIPRARAAAAAGEAARLAAGR